MELNVRLPPRLDIVLDAESDSGVYLEDWAEIEVALNNLLTIAHLSDVNPKSISNVVRGIISPDPRERKICFEITLCLAEKRVLNRNHLTNILVEFLLDEIPHYGIDLILNLLNKLGDITTEEVCEIYIPLLTKPLNIKIRKEIIYGVTTVYIYTTLDIIFTSIHKNCRRFDGLNSFVSLIIVETCIDSIEIISKESCMLAVGIFSMLLEKELQQTTKRLCDLFDDCAFVYKVSKNSQVFVEGLFDVVYKLSQTYWKKTEQILICQMLQKLFQLNNSVFDESLQKYNQTRLI